MIKILNVVWPSAEQYMFAIEGSRNALSSWDKMDSNIMDTGIDIGPNDEKRMNKLLKAGPEHRKMIQGLMIGIRIEAPLLWWNEFDTYRIGTVKSSTSTRKSMLVKDEITADMFSFEDVYTRGGKELIDSTIKHLNFLRDNYLASNEPEEKQKIWREMNELIPKSWNYIRNVFVSFETAINICKQRAGHPHPEWKPLIDLFMSEPWILQALET